MKTMKSLVCSILLALPMTGAIAQACHPVDMVRARGGVLGSVRSPGNYCLQTDLTQPNQFDIHAMTFKTTAGASLLSIRCTGNASCRQLTYRDVADIDLSGHTLDAESKDMVGIAGHAWRGGVTIHNGAIRVPGSRDTNIGIDLQSDLDPLTRPDGTRCAIVEQACGASANGNAAPAYQTTRYLIDKVEVHAGVQGIRMIGNGNTVRNSVIEVDGWSGLALFGKQSLVENNTIILHAKGDALPSAAAIQLRDAEGSILRNNRIVFKGGRLDKAPPAIRLIDSSDVQLEGNTFEGFDGRIEQVGTSSYRINR
jgi:hypothetical protein